MAKIKYDSIIEIITKYFLRFLMGLLIICLIVRLWSVLISTYHDIFSPPYFLFMSKDWFYLLKDIVTLVVGIELVKSLQIIASFDKIPVKTILQIALIAMANKLIASDPNDTADYVMFIFGLAALTLALGGYIFLSGNSEKNNHKKNDG